MSETLTAPNPAETTAPESIDGLDPTKLPGTSAEGNVGPVTGDIALGESIKLDTVAEKDAKPSERNRTFGAKIIELSETRSYRKAVREVKDTGLASSLEKRKAKVKDAKEAYKFAKHGYKRKEKKSLIREATGANIIAKTNERRESGQLAKPKQKEAKGILGRIGSRLDLRSQKRAYKQEIKNIHKESKSSAKQTITQRESDARAQLELRKNELKLAKLRRNQTRLALRKSKLHIGGSHANIISSAKANKTDEQRLSDLDSRRNLNAYFQKNEHTRNRINKLNSRITELKPAVPLNIVAPEVQAAQHAAAEAIKVESTDVDEKIVEPSRGPSKKRPQYTQSSSSTQNQRKAA